MLKWYDQTVVSTSQRRREIRAALNRSMNSSFHRFFSVMMTEPFKREKCGGEPIPNSLS